MTHQPKVVQLHFDGIEVLRIEDGKECYKQLVAAAVEPDLIEMRWDGEIVYALAPKSSQVLINRLGAEPKIPI